MEAIIIQMTETAVFITKEDNLRERKLEKSTEDKDCEQYEE